MHIHICMRTVYIYIYIWRVQMQKPLSTSDVFLLNEHFFLATKYRFQCKYWYF